MGRRGRHCRCVGHVEVILELAMGQSADSISKLRV